MELALATGTHINDIIFANPIKNTKDLRFAAQNDIMKMTFDNEAELYKIKEHCPNAQLVLRLLPDDSGSVMRFGVKFGAPYSHIHSLLATAKKLDLNVIGTSFHIGSGCFDPQSYHKAIALCREVFNIAHTLRMPRFTFLDLGGGFPGTPVEMTVNQPDSTPSFESFAAVIRQALNEYFPTEGNEHVRIVAEPGRYMATSYSTLFTYVQGKREEPSDPKNPSAPRKFLYYINDGVYGAFNCIMFDHANPKPVPAYRFMNDRIALEQSQQFTTATIPGSNYTIPVPTAIYSNLFNSPAAAPQYMNARGLHVSSADNRDKNCLATFFGPTCDSMDVIANNNHMEELFVGDWLGFELMGAYTNAAASNFNGMAKANAFYCRSKQASPFIPKLGL
jgi:ornithine decarboxylase